MASSTGTRHVALTGQPGIGKTTLVKKVCEVLKMKNVKVRGFFTEEVRTKGRRCGFDVVTTDGQRAVLSRISDGNANFMKDYRVGQYSVDIESFESLALPELRLGDKENGVVIIDEIGKMELFSSKFKQSIQTLFSSPLIKILTTIPVAKGKPIPFVEAIRNNPDVHLFTVSRDNRDELAEEILDVLLQHKVNP